MNGDAYVCNLTKAKGVAILAKLAAYIKVLGEEIQTHGNTNIGGHSNGKGVQGKEKDSSVDNAGQKSELDLISEIIASFSSLSSDKSKDEMMIIVNGALKYLDKMINDRVENTVIKDEQVLDMLEYVKSELARDDTSDPQKLYNEVMGQILPLIDIKN